MVDDDELIAFRDRFPILADTTYLVSHSLGAMPEGVHVALAQFATTWQTRGIRAWAEGWWDMPLEIGDELAPIIGAPPRSIAMHQNVSVTQSLVLSCLEPTPTRNAMAKESETWFAGS